MSPILWLLLWFAGSQAPPDAARGSIQGIVVRADAVAAAAPAQLPQARVELKPGNRSVMTDANGAFAFRSLPSGQYTITVMHDGFVLQEDRKRGITPYGLTITVDGGKDLKDIVLPMIPAPVIVGRMFDPAGDSLAGALVRAYVRQYTPLGTRLKIARKAMTNDMGEFRLFGLTFGQYFVSGGYSDRDRAAGIGKVQLSSNVAKADDGYPTLFYDGRDDISQARPALLAPGSDNGSLDLYLKEGARYLIRGQIVPPVRGISILFAPKGSDLADAAYSLHPNAAGSFEISAVSPGVYLLLATNDDTLSSDVIQVNVTDHDVDGVRIGLKETITVTGTIASEGNPRTDLSRLHLRLTRSTNEFEQKFEAPVTADGTFTIAHVPIADFDISIEPLPTGTYVKSISAQGRNLLGGNARLLPDEPLRIVLNSPLDSLPFQVTKGTNPAPGAQVILIPAPPLRRRADRYVTGYTDASGHLTLTAVPPGNYTAYAFEEIEPDSYYALANSYAAQDRLRVRSVFVVIEDPPPPQPMKPIELKLIPAEETIGGFQ
jgi:hypothetical protein